MATVINLLYPCTHADAAARLTDFLHQRFSHYGAYQDAIVSGENWLFHSLLTPTLNTGLLSPMQVIEQAIDHSRAQQIPVNSLEGFIRQVLGWRGYTRAVYDARGVQQRTTNHWQHTRRIPESLWVGTTGIVPVDDAIHRLLRTGYNHHIERRALY
jgi:deoxyribodipyrimidine photolyase-related protein